jgi:galactose oxidase
MSISPQFISAKLLLCAAFLTTVSGCGDAVGPEPSVGRTPAAASEAQHVGIWSGPLDLPTLAIHAHVLPSGTDVLFWNSHGHHGQGLDHNAFIWSIGTTQFTRVALRETDLYCSGHAFLPDGRLFAAGGHVSEGEGLPDANIFDSRTNTWTRLPPMREGRWYPTVTTLPNGDMLVTGGSVRYPAVMVEIPEVWETAAERWRTLDGARKWLHYYPWTHVVPDGRIYYSGLARETAFLDPSGSGKWSPGPRRVGTPVPDYGSSVMYEPGKILVVGGGDPPSNIAEVIDLTGDARWKLTGPMRYARRNLNATLLADGTVLAIGGSSAPGANNAAGAVLAAELWNPATGEWRTMASMTRKRLYHSTALLLPDGRVFASGSGNPHAAGEFDDMTAEIYTPPYLLNADGTPARRPEIVAAPATVGYGGQMLLQFRAATEVSAVTWVRLPSVTHAFDANQRFLRLRFSVAERLPAPAGPVRSRTLVVHAPTSPNLAPPGHYMMFVLDERGVPSPARIVQIT